ncbi:hypothetical protein ES332_D05G389800v1 [Gossypium tomentosum]|uniref:Uncharacterized protein n=1 Tax=Gossypium tomentosum TaxID=34277 RepID=A0A5D2L5D6_GOSTO|nr:hypothetical protein ES332_D05G389800v1 [Gossypium tomentosum]
MDYVLVKLCSVNMAMVAIRKSQAMRVMERKMVRMMAKWRIAMKMMKRITRKIWKKVKKISALAKWKVQYNFHFLIK